MKYNYGKEIASLVGHINTNMKKDIQNKFCQCEFTIPQMTVLSLLMQYGELRISDISRLMGLANSTVSGVIDRLEKMKLVTRIRSQHDRRVVTVSIAPQYREMSRQFEMKLENYFADLFQNTAEEDLADIMKGLEKLNTILCQPRQL